MVKVESSCNGTSAFLTCQHHEVTTKDRKQQLWEGTSLRLRDELGVLCTDKAGEAEMPTLFRAQEIVSPR